MMPVGGRGRKVLIVHTAYWSAISSTLRSRQSQLASSSDSQSLVSNLALSANYTPGLRSAGIPTSDHLFNWPEHRDSGFDASSSRFDLFQFEMWQSLLFFPGVRGVFNNHGKPYFVLRRRIEVEKPDVVLFLNVNVVTPALAYWIKSRGIEIWGQHASALPSREILKNFNFLFSALPWQVELFRGLGVKSEILPLGIPTTQVVQSPKPLKNREIDLSFVGSIGWTHKPSLKLLQDVAEAVPGFRVYTSAPRAYLRRVGLLRNHAGEAHGHRGLEVYRDSKVVLNRHIGVAQGYSANFRMYEATGSGAVLLTEESRNLREIFKSNEAMTYRTAGEAITNVQRVLENPANFQDLASAGYQRTLADHTIERRAERIAEWLST